MSGDCTSVFWEHLTQVDYVLYPIDTRLIQLLFPSTTVYYPE